MTTVENRDTDKLKFMLSKLIRKISLMRVKDIDLSLLITMSVNRLDNSNIKVDLVSQDKAQMLVHLLNSPNKWIEKREGKEKEKIEPLILIAKPLSRKEKHPDLQGFHNIKNSLFQTCKVILMTWKEDKEILALLKNNIDI